MVGTAAFPYLVVLFVTGIILAVVVYSLIAINQLSGKSIAMIHSAHQTMTDVAVAHLWLDEIAAGVAHEDPSAVLSNLDRAEGFYEVLLSGGEFPEGNFTGIEEPALREKITAAAGLLEKLREMTRHSLENPQEMRLGSPHDLKVDLAFNTFMRSAEDVKDGIHILHAEDLQSSIRQHLYLILACLSVSILVIAAVFKYRRSRAEIEGELGDANRQIVKSKIMLQRVFDGISEPLLMVDDTMRIKMLNAAAREYYRVKEYRQAVGTYCFESFGKHSSPCKECKVRLAIAAGTTGRFQRKGFMDPGRLEEITVYPISTEETGSQGLIIRINDVTEAKKIREQLVRADRLSSLGQLSSGIAHEIRNPLAGISLFTDLLSEREEIADSEGSQNFVSEIKGNIKRIDAIIKRVLDYSRPTVSSEEKLRINDQILEVLKLWRVKLINRKIRLELPLQEGIPFLLGDAVGLQQVLQNLIMNSYEAMPEGGVLKITSRTGISSYFKDREVVNIVVTDTGQGFRPDDIEKIFNPFFTTKATGTGLGLAISHRIVEMHGGVITAVSRPGKGTRMTIELPAQKGGASRGE